MAIKTTQGTTYWIVLGRINLDATTYSSHDVAPKFKDSDQLYDVINLYFKEDKVIEQSYLDSLFT